MLPPASRLSTWRRLYGGVAAFNILTVLVSVWFGTRVLTDYRESVALANVWSERLETLTVLSDLATSVEVVAEEAIRTGRFEPIRTRVNAAMGRFQSVMDGCSADWNSDRRVPVAAGVRPDMARLESSMARLAAETDRILQTRPAPSPYARPTAPLAVVRVELNDSIHNLRARIREHLDVVLAAQLKRSEALAPLAYAIGTLVLFMVLGAMWYGRRLSDALAEADKRIQRNLILAHGANRAKSDFLANMSHEIRTPMTAILGYGELLESPSQSDWKDHVAAIRRSGEHLLSVINDILDLSKIEAGKMTVESLECSPVEIARDVHTLMAPRFRAKGLTLNLELRFPLPLAIRSDAVRIRQILINLTGNALKFTERGGATIMVTMTDLDAPEAPEPGSLQAILTLPHATPHIAFQVVDSGIGIDPNRLERLFEPFTQNDESTTRRFGGTGLGLSISRRFARLLGGDLLAESAPGEGSAFTAIVATGVDRSAPLIMAEEAAPAPRAAPATAGADGRADPAADRLAGGARILLVDDGIDNRRLLTRFLETAGATVETAENGRIALDRVLNIPAVVPPPQGRAELPPIDLVLMDMQMPEMDGYTATRALRDAGVTIPILALTAHAMEGERDRCLAAGCSDYLTKPIPKRTLVEACRKWLTPPQALNTAA